MEDSKRDQCKRVVEDLPPDISLDIIQRLPFTSFIRFKYVCKAWHRLACHPALIGSYSDSSNYPCLIALSVTRDRLYLIDSCLIRDLYNGIDCNLDGAVTRINTPSEYKINSFLCCNGLLCLSYYEYHGSHECERVYIHNPITGEYMFTPDLETRIRGEQYISFFGFGYHPSTKEYKVVRIVEDRCANVWGEKLQTRYSIDGRNIELFTLGTKGWRCDIYNPFLIEEKSSDVVVNGALHWFGETRGRYYRMIVSFDLEKNKFHEIASPNCDNNSFNKRLVVLGGCLSMTICNQNQMHIWRMKCYGMKESWVKEFVITESWARWIQPLCLLKNGGLFFSVSNRKALYFYETESKWFEVVLDEKMFQDFYTATPYYLAIF